MRLIAGTLMVYLSLGFALTLAPTPAFGQTAGGLPPQGLYDQCPPSSLDHCVSRLARMRSVGFSLVLNYAAWAGRPSDVLAFADSAHRYGVKIIWPLNHPAWRDRVRLPTTYTTLFKECGCDSEDFFAYLINLVKDHPATWGFYIGDELPASQLPQVRQLAQQVKLLAPALPHLYIALGGNREMVSANLLPYANVAEFGGVDHYPIGWGGDPEGIRGVAEMTRAIMTTAGKQAVLVLQAFSWSQYPKVGSFPQLFPTREEMLRMRDLALLYGRPAILLWYSYHDILRAPDPEQRWRDVVAAAFAPTPRMLQRVTFPSKVLSDAARRVSTRAGLRACKNRKTRLARTTCRGQVRQRYRRPQVRVELADPVEVEVKVTRSIKRGKILVGRRLVTARRRLLRLTIPVRPLRPGVYELEVAVPAGPEHRRLRVRVVG